MLHQEAPVRQLRQAVVVREVPDVELRLLTLDGITDGANHHLRCRLAFDQIILGAALDRLQRQCFVFRSRENHQRQIRGRAHKAVQRLQFLRVGQAQIEKRDIIGVVRQAIDGASHRRRVVQPDASGPHSLQHRLRERRLIRIVLDEEDPKGRLLFCTRCRAHVSLKRGKVEASGPDGDCPAIAVASVAYRW